MGERAIIRLSGPESLPIAQKVFLISSPEVTLEQLGGFRWCDGRVRLDNHLELPARAYVFRTPRSYTRQDVVELHVPGSPSVAAGVLDTLLQFGARQAGPGEFTARAFFSGRIDLSRAQAVADVIDAADDVQLRSAMSVLGGRVHRLCQQAAAECTDVLALIEASIDMADEDLEFETTDVLARRIGSLASHLRDVASNACDVSETGDRPHVVIAGRPNVGKSSLMNRLTGTDRAIVSALAGTTRDVLSVTMDLLDGVAIELQDVAGFMAVSDTLEAAADSAARAAVSCADVVMLVVDHSSDDFVSDVLLLEEIRQANRRAEVLLLVNKVDLSPRDNIDALLAPLEEGMLQPTLRISSQTGEGLECLRKVLMDLLHLNVQRGGEALGLHARQKRCLLAAAEAADRAADMLGAVGQVIDVAELAAIEVRHVLAELGQISGQVVTEDILGRIFQRFCVGK